MGSVSPRLHLFDKKYMCSVNTNISLVLSGQYYAPETSGILRERDCRAAVCPSAAGVWHVWKACRSQCGLCCCQAAAKTRTATVCPACNQLKLYWQLFEYKDGSSLYKKVEIWGLSKYFKKLPCGVFCLKMSVWWFLCHLKNFFWL